MGRSVKKWDGADLGEGVVIPVDGESVRGDLTLVPGSTGLVGFAYGSGSSRFSPRERYVAGRLNQVGLSTLFLDLLTLPEEEEDRNTGIHRFNIPLLARRLEGAVEWAKKDPRTKGLVRGLFGGSTGAAACLIAAADEGDDISAVVSRGGRTDLADQALPLVTAATLFIVGGDDTEVLEINQESFRHLRCPDRKLEVVRGATHLFEEPGKLEEVARLASQWFVQHMKK
jgi:pimeloyl-ACP methyl ester carboxylesterase